MPGKSTAGGAFAVVLALSAGQLKRLVLISCLLALQACKHPLVIVGEGDIVDANNSGHGCTLEQFQAQDTACTENEVSGDYFVNYKAEPRPGWRFVRWKGPCSPRSDFQYCLLEVSAAAVASWDATYPDVEIPPSTAVFEAITGESGFLLGPVAVAGVAYETPSQQGVTGLDGSFQYEEGELVRFMVGDTLLGEVPGQPQVTPFDLAGSPVITGININWALHPWTSPLPQSSPSPHVLEGEDEGVDPFNGVINIAVLLQSLDTDGKPETGIQISPGITTLLRGVSLDLGQEWAEFLSKEIEGFDGFGGREEFEDFQNQTVSLYEIVREANSRRRFSVTHGVVNPAPALQQLYETLGIDARTFAPCGGPDSPLPWFPFENSNWRCQYDADGNLAMLDLQMDSAEYMASYQYDASGNVIHEAANWDVGEAGAQHQVSSWQYNAIGDLTRRETDDDDDSEAEIIESWQYDASGRLTQYEIDSDGDPQRQDSWQYDAAGNLTRYEQDHDGDGIADAVEGWQYDANDRLTLHEIDGDGDGIPEQYERGQYDQAGNLTRYEQDQDGDGNADYSTSWQYDAAGNLTRYEEIEQKNKALGQDGRRHTESWQYDADGNVIRYERYTDDRRDEHYIETSQYDDLGNLIRQTRDDKLDENPEEVVIYAYDADGNMTRRASDADNDGIFENGQRLHYDAVGKLTRLEYDWKGREPYRTDSWQYDTNARLTRYEIDRKRTTRNPDSIESWQYNAAGQLTRYATDEEGDGTPEYSERWTFNTNGKLTRHETESAESPLIFERWQYDAEGNLTRVERNHGGDSPGAIQSWQYQTTGWGHMFSPAQAGEAFFRLFPP